MKIHTLGFPRIGARREFKKALESFWKGQSDLESLLDVGKNIRTTNWNHQSFLDLVPVGDFSLYDHILDMSFTLGNIPERAIKTDGNCYDKYFRVARGRSANDTECNCIHAGEMTKWFDTNYHYIVPEFSQNTTFKINAERILNQIDEAQASGVNAKPVIVGPVTYLYLGKGKGEFDKQKMLGSLVEAYKELLETIAAKGVEWVQIDEPALVTELDESWLNMFRTAYPELAKTNVKLLLTTYFGELQDNLDLAVSLPTEAIHIDAVRGKKEIDAIIQKLPENKCLSLGLIDGRNIWKTDLDAVLEQLKPIAEKLGERLWLAPSCSLLHVPVDLDQELEMDEEIKSWLAFAIQKLSELKILSKAINEGDDVVATELESNRNAINSRRFSERVNNPVIRERLKTITPQMGERKSSYSKRTEVQKNILQLPLFPTTTIGSFPQTREIRSTRLQFRKGELSQADYIEKMQAEIKLVVDVQEQLGLDVLVHGEPERNDMVEYFGELLEGYVFSRFGWVQSYGSRCVKPPILFGDISRPEPMTVEWSKYAQSLTDKPMKGMLTGPVTILNWSFVRDDQSRRDTCLQLALAIRDEVQDLEKAGIKVIQIDEAALREGLPLRKSQWQQYLDWAVGSFKITANGVEDETQIHTHMCYSEFNDIIAAIADMDADVITIETSRSDMELLDVFDEFAYPNEIAPGVYDIHSPNVPTKEAIIDLMEKASKRIPKERLWVNPDCGLKTRAWPETKAALQKYG